ncbi:AAA domain-containing protein [Streptomyces wuyuanensis]|uniref:AAA domain-containing protein n=1 Tax=Streptomyces wuyuanensis TaxID=1196353 RepID=UPI003D730CB3
MTLTAGVSLLNGRYELTGPLASATDEGQLWAANDTTEFVKPYLLKAWPFPDAKPDDVQRALWDAELRTLYQVRSTPGSEGSLLQLQDVGIDHEHRCFVMVFKAEGLNTLASLLADRPRHDWLSGRTTGRRELWQMLGRIAQGLSLLHEQQVVHRCVAAESVFLDPGEGPESCRLGGFEWSVRLGRPAGAQLSRVGWETTPEALGGSTAFGPDVDWFAFGMLVARCMMQIEHLGSDPNPLARYRHVLDRLAKAKKSLTPLEHDFIGRLIAEDPAIRPRHGTDITTTIREIVQVLQRSQAGTDASAQIVVINPHSRRLQETCMERGLRAAMNLGPADSFDPNRPDHVTQLISFLYKDFTEGATLAPLSDRDRYVLSGRALHLKIGPARSLTGSTPTWQNAFCEGTLDYFSADASRQVRLPPGRLTFFSTKDYKPQGHVLNAAPSWEPLLPKADQARDRRRDQEQFAEFVRLTNQIDILIRDAELFRCRVVDVEENDGIVTAVHVEEVARVHQPLAMLRPDGGMAGFLLREKNSGKRGSHLIQLCSPDIESIDRTSSSPEWEVTEVDIPGRTATLRPTTDVVDPPEVGDIRVLRTKGLHGQVKLIRRRKDAIARLEKHTYLLESLSSPGQVIMDSGPVQLPVKLSEKVVDSSKRSQIEKILGVRPIYTLQGPPGTGKTHMVAWLLREILEEDPVAQVLITAQAHPAVDVLRAKVEQEAFKGIPEERRPLAIRLRRTDNGQSAGLVQDEPGSEQQVTKSLLENTIRRLEAAAHGTEPSQVQTDWLESCRIMLKDLNTRDASSAKEFRELVKRSASITYSTTGDGDLAALADEVSYDWAIVEEAGKAHGFELALPLGLGHRWLLIGDPKQLPPYRIEEYQKAVSDLDATVAALEGLEGIGNLLDTDLLQTWRARTQEQRKEFGEYCKSWLKLFEQLHRLCAYHEHDDGLLTGQHRMHPDIGELVSEVYYKGRLEHYTRDKKTLVLKPEIIHPLTAPAELTGKAVVWLDVPWCTDDPRTREFAVPKYRNPAEAHALEQFLRSLRATTERKLNLAVLSPYTQQVGYLRRKLDDPRLRQALGAAGLSLAPDPRRSLLEGPETPQDGFFTVDSFQGNQSQIIAVSLVRNNAEVAGKGLGFLVEAPRMNVLLSRAELLLVLVGSWDFFREQVRHVSRNPQEESKLQHLAFAVDQLQTLFDEKRAVRIPADLRDFAPPSRLG